MEWRRENSSEALTQDKFAPVLKTVIDTYLKADGIRNGFVTTGLYPWNPDAIDYSKCLGKSKISEEGPRSNTQRYEKVEIALEKFQEIVGNDLIDKFKKVNEMTKQESEEFWILYKLWKQYNYNGDATSRKIDHEEVQDEGDESYQLSIKPIIIEAEGDSNEGDESYQLSTKPIIRELEGDSDATYRKTDYKEVQNDGEEYFKLSTEPIIIEVEDNINANEITNRSFDRKVTQVKNCHFLVRVKVGMMPHEYSCPTEYYSVPRHHSR
ncbi:hypothetical protein NQ317_017224 [Molorchus minor]|uniref:Uncharacterized protein n=1 Tax=Molorchus minor TaxID=1323400 RepID=A0ABQ9JI20_9CUCU|nr:hypothetical protein NQ317_017224 [Molorchus minor]